MEVLVGIVSLAAGMLMLMLWWWNDIWYALPAILRGSSSGAKLPPGYMGIPFLGEMLKFLWYFKVVRRPDELVNTMRRKYGDRVGLCRSHLFGSPSIVAYTPSANKFVLQDSSSFTVSWPSMELVGFNSISSLRGASHLRIRSFVTRAINQPDPLRQIALMVQPRIAAALDSWAQKGRVVVFKEANKLTFENIGKYFANMEPGPTLDALDELFKGLTDGFRANPINIPGTAFHHALQCRKKAMVIFREELEKRKLDESCSDAKNDLMEGLMQMKDEEGKKLQDVEILDNIVGLVLGGYTSTSVNIMWGFYYLAKYPHVLKKLREEQLLVRKKLDQDFVTYNDILACDYINKVVDEVIRLANVSSVVFRTELRDVEFKGHIIPKGWKVVCWLRHIHTDPQNFEDPMCFNPDRWNERPKPGTNLVFGAGPRICAGNMLARMQIAVILHHLVVGYKWELVNPNAETVYLPHPKPEDGVEIDISKI